MRCARNVALTGEKKNAYRLSVEKSEGTRPQGRPRGKWVDNIERNLEEIVWIVWGGMDWIGLGQDTDNWRVPQN
jgi:hypothetical protein